MSSGLVWSNLVTYSLQIGLLVALASLVPALLRLRMPGARLVYWHVLLAACLLLPLVRPWRQEVLTDNTSVTTTVIAVGQNTAPATRSLPKTEIALGLLLLGVAVRLGWLAAGFWRLGRYRRDSQPYRTELVWNSRAEFRIADQISSPVTFGARRPVVLLPPAFPSLDERQQTAILCHELLHVERGDWLFTVAEELVRAVFWFHPAIWWLLGEIQLAREQAVDREVIERTQAKDEYVDALLAIAGAHAEADLAPAPLFLRKRHLKQRVLSILKEARMSRTRLVSALAAGLCILMAVCWFVASTFPLSAAPQVVSDAPGVAVDLGGAAVLHRSPVMYPESARAKGIAGNIVVEVHLDGSGNVADARVLSGPEELRSAALRSVLQWHFGHDAAGSTRQVTVGFTPPSGAATEERKPVMQTVATVDGSGPAPDPQAMALTLQKLQAELAQVSTPEMRTAIQGRIAQLQRQLAEAPSRASVRRTVKSINVIGLPDAARDELLAKLPLHVGASDTLDNIRAMGKTVRDFDEHLTFNVNTTSADEEAVYIVSPNPAIPATKPADSAMAPLKIGGNMQSAKLVSQPRPIYPPDAKAARVQGVVKLSAIIAADGHVKNLEVLSGHPLLVPAALESVKQWVYQTTLLNGEPVEVQTQIDVNFTLSQ